MKPTNLLFILSDQHTRDALGCYGHPLVQTPNLDRLAEAGVRFTGAYTTCPICVPARASLMTGRYVHQTGHWDNGHPYDGTPPGWGHRLKQQGYRADSIGKLHFRSPEDDNGFTEEVDPLHVVEGIGDLLGCIRDDPPFRTKRDGITGAGPGDSTYLRYDASNTTHALRWLADHRNDDKPWVLFLSFVCPHPPYIAPEEFYRLYPLDRIPMPPQWRPEDWPDDPAIAYFRRFFGFHQPFEKENIRRLIATYYGVCTYLDHQIGQVLAALQAHGLEETTRVIYTSDHGDSLGARGLFGKFTMYDEAAAVPFLMAGPEVPVGKTVRTPISFVDCFPTILEAVGARPEPEDQALPGESLWAIAQEDDRDRLAFSEYHAVGSRRAAFMLRNLRFKYVYYVDDPPQLFDLVADPREEQNLAGRPEYGETLREFEAHLRRMLDPEAVDAQARASQRAKIAAFGGEAAVLRRGSFQNSPAPGETPSFQKFG